MANTGDDSLSLIDLKGDISTQKIYLLGLVEEGRRLGVYDMCISEEGLLYIINSYDDSVMKVDLENARIIDLLKVGRNPTCIKIFGGKIYVVNSDSNSISIIDESSFSLIEDISVGEKPTDIQIDERDLKIFIANENSHNISVLDLASENILSIDLNKQPIKMAIEDKRLFVLSYINNGVTNYSNLSEFGMENYKAIMSIDLKGISTHMIKIKDQDLFYISNPEDGYVYVIHKGEEVNISKILLGGMPGSIVLDKGNRLYITNTLNNDLTIVDQANNKIIKNIRVGKEPNGALLLF